MKPEGLKYRSTDTEVFRPRTIRLWNNSNRSRKGGSRLVKLTRKLGRTRAKRELRKTVNNDET